MSDAFWTGGHQAYVSGQRKHYEPLLRALRLRYENAIDEADRAEIGAEISQAEAEYRAKLSEIEDALF